jgi:hypothetical protein
MKCPEKYIKLLHMPFFQQQKSGGVLVKSGGFLVKGGGVLVKMGVEPNRNK